MKKKLEAELISIAHRILKLKNKSELIQLQKETLKLYEKLSVLRFVEENFENVKPTIGLKEIEKNIESVFDQEEVEDTKIEEVQPIEDSVSRIEEVVKDLLEDTRRVEIEEPKVEEVQPLAEVVPELIEEELISTEIEEKEEEEVKEDSVSRIEEIVKDLLEDTRNEEIETSKEEIIKESFAFVPEGSFFKPDFELTFDAKEEVKEKEEVKPSPQISFDDLLGSNYSDPVFVKPEELEKEKQKSEKKRELEAKTASLNDQVSKGIAIGLNDRIAFIKHLFANNPEDYNRVLSQLITFNSLQEVQFFINEMVKPDYNNWEGKEEYSQRFMEIIEKKFS